MRVSLSRYSYPHTRRTTGRFAPAKEGFAALFQRDPLDDLAPKAH